MGGIRGSGEGKKSNFIFLNMAKLYQIVTNVINSLWLFLSIILRRLGFFNISLYNEKYIVVTNLYIVPCICLVLTALWALEYPIYEY